MIVINEFSIDSTGKDGHYISCSAYMTKRVKQLILLVGDASLFELALYFMLLVRYQDDLTPELWFMHTLPFGIIGAITLFIFYINRLYELPRIRVGFRSILTLIRSTALVFVTSISYFYFVPTIAPKRNLVITLAFFLLLLIPWRRFYSMVLSMKNLQREIVLIGRNRFTKRLIRYIKRHPELGFRVRTIIQKSADLKKIQKKVYSEALFILNKPSLQRPFLLAIQQHTPAKVSIISFQDFYEETFSKVFLEMQDESELLQVLVKPRPWYEIGKRVLDITIGLLALLLFIIIFIPLAIVIKTYDRGPIFYRQKRMGKHGKLFTIIKLRTMRLDAEKDGPRLTLKHDPRITRPGLVLRSLYIDELPQSLLLIRGYMSVVGPRPERPEFVKDLKKEIPLYDLRHLVKPGITGWAQINQRSPSSMKEITEKTKYDLYYIKKRSMLFDIGIVLKTLSLIFKHI